MKKKFKMVGISETAHEEARFLSNITDRAIGSLIEEYLEYLFGIACTYENANLEYEVDGDSVKVVVTGRNNLVVGECKSPNAEAESKFPQLVKNVEEYKPQKQVNKK